MQYSHNDKSDKYSKIDKKKSELLSITYYSERRPFTVGLYNVLNVATRHKSVSHILT